MDVLQKQITKLESRLAELQAQKAAKETSIKNTIKKIQNKNKNNLTTIFDKNEWSRLKASQKQIDQVITNMNRQLQALKAQLNKLKPRPSPRPFVSQTVNKVDNLDDQTIDKEYEKMSKDLEDTPIPPDATNKVPQYQYGPSNDSDDELLSQELDELMKENAGTNKAQQPQYNYGDNTDELLGQQQPQEPQQPQEQPQEQPQYNYGDDTDELLGQQPQEQPQQQLTLKPQGEEQDLESKQREEENQMIDEFEKKYGYELPNDKTPQLRPDLLALEANPATRTRTRTKTRRNNIKRRETQGVEYKPTLGKRIRDSENVNASTKKMKNIKREPKRLLRQPMTGMTSPLSEPEPINNGKKESTPYGGPSVVPVKTPTFEKPNEENGFETSGNDVSPKQPATSGSGFRDSLKPTAVKVFPVPPTPKNAGQKIICPAILKTGKNVTKKFFVPSQFPNLTRLKSVSQMKGGRVGLGKTRKRR